MTRLENKASTTETMAITNAIVTFHLDGIDLVGQQDLKWPLVVLAKIAAVRTRRDGLVPRILQRMMG